MGKEIEHKYLVVDDTFVAMSSGCRHMVQGYLSIRPEATVRVRIADEMAYITVKSKNKGDVRNEWEYPIPVEDAREMLGNCCSGVIEKDRWLVPYGGFTWEVDVFGGRLKGLVIAEIELPESDTHYALPPFVGRNVTGDPKYYNSYLSQIVIKE